MSQDIDTAQYADEIDLFELISILIKNLLGIAGITTIGFAVGLAYGLIAPPTYEANISFATNYNSVRSEILCDNALCKSEIDFRFLSDFEDLETNYKNLTAKFTYKNNHELTNLIDVVNQRISADSKLIFEDSVRLSNYLLELDKGIEPATFIVEQRIRTKYRIEKFESGVNFATIEQYDSEKIGPRLAIVTVLATLAALMLSIFGFLFSHYYRGWKDIRN